jgi:mannose-6-phosphate isomerase-like protein (cupin superfamily)
MFNRAGERRPFKPHDVIFVPAGMEHRFEGFSDDFQTWVVFWGPTGGEAAA